MDNIDKPSGARVIGGHSGVYEGQLTKMLIPASNAVATFINDIVSILGSSDVNGIAHVEQAAQSATPCGIIVGMEPDYSNLELKYRPASTDRYVWVNTDPKVVFEIQASGAFVAADIGSNAEWVAGAGSVTSGLSGMQLDSAFIAPTSTFGLAIESIMQREDNDIGNFAKVICSFNVHQYGSVGVAGA